jgi:hypothetical protein
MGAMSDNQMKYSCKMPVGAWGYWGHKRHEYYHISCNRTLNEIRDVHFSCIDVLGFNIGEICGNYQESEVDDEIAKKLEAVKIYVPEEPGPDEIFKLWMDILQYIDRQLKYEIVDPPDIAFVGKDTKGRTFDAPGYGVFD